MEKGMGAPTSSGEKKLFDGFKWVTEAQAKAEKSEGQKQNAHEISYTARRVYIGNLPADGTFDNEELRNFISQSMMRAGIHDLSKTGHMILSVHRDASLKWAFLEFRTVAEANSCLHLNGLALRDKTVMINRTRDYTPVSDVDYPKLYAAGVIGSTVLSPDGKVMNMPSGAQQAAASSITPTSALPAAPSDSRSGPIASHASIGGVPQILLDNTRKVRKVFVGNLNPTAGINAEVLSTFFTEAMKSASLIDPAQKGDLIIWSYVDPRSHGFGFIEFRSIAEAQSCFALNGIEVYGRKVHVNRIRDYEPYPQHIDAQLRKYNLLGSTSISPDGQDVFGDEIPNPEGETAVWQDLQSSG
mmetsp:Transcript_12287/g.20700  ORF Transcript_12287/g.20700 Transcript_12287/m.20700 type:complete len:357 (+) Transcript_12287:116-1186(+)